MLEERDALLRKGVCRTLPPKRSSPRGRVLESAHMIGQTIAHYKLTARIGAGGMGEVYRATDSKLHRDVAVKVLPPAFAEDPERMARFEREAQVLASLNHGSIAAVFGIEESGAQRAIVMELVEGEDLSERLKRGPLPLDEALRTAVHIAGALEVAHDRGVIHRDLKPANIKLLESGDVKLLDFGLAKALDDAAPQHIGQDTAATLSAAQTRAGIIMGTAAYMSPEQATGATADKRSDVWSFGVVLFEMLTGQRLFDGETTSHLLADVIRAEIDFNRLPPDLPADLRTLLELLLVRDPRRRLRDVREARLVLERLLERGSGRPAAITSGTMAMPAPAAVRPVARTGQLRRLWPVAAIVLLAAVAAAGWLRPSPEPPPQVRAAVRLADVPFFTSVGSAFDISPHGTQIAVATGTSDSGENRRLLLRRVNELDSTLLVDATSSTDEGASPYNPFFSPDGAWVGYALAGELRKIPATGGTPLRICTVSRSRGATWGEDGTIVLAPSPSSGLVRVSAAGGEPTPLTTLNAEAKEVTHRWPQFLPGGKAVLFTSHTSAAGGFDGAKIEVLMLDSGERRVIHTGGAYARYVPTGHVVYVHNNTLMAVPFDLDGFTVTGAAVPVVQNLAASANEGSGQFAYAASGLLIYLQGVPELPTHPIAWVDRSGGMTTLVGEPGTYANPRLSPDGTRLSLTVYRNRNWDIWVYDLERKVSTRITFDEAPETEQVWSPDGRELIYTSEAVEFPGFFRKAADGSGAPTLVAKLPDAMWAQAWSRDGRLLALTSGQSDIGTLDVTAPDPKPAWLLNSRFAETDPTISPDGRWFAYTSSESGRPEIYIREFPNGQGRWQVSTTGGGYARWSPKGDEVFYRTTDGIMAAVVERTPGGIRPGTPKLVVRGSFMGGPRGIELGSSVFSDYDVSADGQRFVMFPKPPELLSAATGMVTMVTNWFDDLRRATQ